MLFRSTQFLACLTAAKLCSALPTQRRQETGNSTSYGRLIVFGDSFSDNGNGAWPASNFTWPADPAYYNHSFSNGPKWADRLAGYLGSELLDYAAGGATADNSFVQGYTGPESTIPVPSTYDQLERFLKEDAVRENDVFVHWIGANDALFNTSITGAQITSLINRDVDILYRAGAKTVLFGNYQPVNTFPATYGMADYDFADDYATGLDTGLRNIVAGYEAYMWTALVDIQAFYNQIFADPEAYGIDPRYVNPPTACLQGAYPSEGVPRSLCTDPERHLYFDVYHPVADVHERIARMFQTTLSDLA